MDYNIRHYKDSCLTSNCQGKAVSHEYYRNYIESMDYFDLITLLDR